MNEQNKKSDIRNNVVVGHFVDGAGPYSSLRQLLTNKHIHFWTVISGFVIVILLIATPRIISSYQAAYLKDSHSGKSAISKTTSGVSASGGASTTTPSSTTPLAASGHSAPTDPAHNPLTTTPSATPTPVPTSSDSNHPNCSGEAVIKNGNDYWVCSFDDEFSGSSYDTSHWGAVETAKTAFSSNRQDCYMNQPNNISVADGYLHLTSRQEPAPITCHDSIHGDYSTRYTSGSLSSIGRFSQTYGRFEMRIKVPNVHVKGLQESFWMWPDNPFDQNPGGAGWPATGEIDIAEIYHYYPDRAIPFLHYAPAVNNDFNVTNNYCMIDISQWHTYTLEWIQNSITISIDNKVCVHDSNWTPSAPQTNPQPFNKPYFMILTQGLGITGNAFDPATTPLPATSLVDYVRVWR